ncbi:MAG: hypothetical protein WCQ87_07655 [Parabacteroides sp.]|jgi:hypothetical protein
MQQATSKEYGQELPVIAKRYRGEDWKIIGHYMNLNLSVRSEYNFSGSSFYKKDFPPESGRNVCF